jgi:hypothetical protein
VLWILNSFFLSGSHFPREVWIRILLDLQNIPDPPLNIHSFIMPTILKAFFLACRYFLND